MTRVRLLLSTIVPSVLAGGFLFASVAGHADAGRDGALGDWPATAAQITGGHPVRVAQADPWAPARGVPPVPPSPPAPPVPPVPPAPRTPYDHHGRNVGVRFHDGKLELDGVQELVEDQLERVDDMLDNLQDLPPGARARIKGRIHAVRGRVRAHLGRLKAVDLDQIGPEMEKMGDEIEKEMEGLDQDLSQFGDKFGKSFEKFGKDIAKSLSVPVPSSAPRAARRDADNSDEADHDDDDDDDRTTASSDPAVDPAVLADLKSVALDADQRAKLAQLRAAADQQIASAKRDLDEMSNQLHSALADIGASEADIARQIDQISAKEAMIRKARILAWVRARSLLSKEQRRQVEAAARKSH